MVGMDIKDPTRQRALLLYLAGPEVEHIFETLPETGEDKDFDVAVTKLSAYVSPKKNITYETHVFRQARQRPDAETMDQFHTRLRHLANTCEFRDADKEIKIQLVEHCTPSRVRKKALKDDPTLEEDLLTFSRSLEISDRQAAELESRRSKEETINFSQKRGVRDRRSPQHRLQPERRTTSSKSYYRCGGSYPHAGGKPCPAIGKTCKVCDRLRKSVSHKARSTP